MRIFGPAENGSDMARKPTSADVNQSTTLNVRVNPALHRSIIEEQNELASRNPGLVVTKSDAARMLIEAGLRAKKATAAGDR